MNSVPSPPRWILDLLRRCCPPRLLEGIEGDLYEQFEADVEEAGLRTARRRFLWHGLTFLRPGILLRNSFTFKIINSMMWSNYFKIAVRNLYKRKVYSLINAVGLSIGIAFCVLIILYVRYERSFDNFQVHKDDIYRIEEHSYNTWRADQDDPYYRSAYLQLGLRDVMKTEVPQVRYATRLSEAEPTVILGDKHFTEKIKMVDRDFFHMFSFPVVEGDTSGFLTDRYHIVLSRTMATKYFPESSPQGKTLLLDYFGSQHEFIVDGVVEDPPTNSSIDFAALIPITNKPYYEQNIDQWSNFNTPLFVQLNSSASLEEFSAGLSRLVDKYMKESLERQRAEAGLAEEVNMFNYTFTPFSAIHLDPDISWYRSSKPEYAYILSGIALLILLIACINYISLSLTTSAGRRMEVGIRKAIGAARNQLLSQFTFESVALAMVSFVISIFLILLFLPKFNEFTNKEIEISGINYFYILLFGFVVALMVGILSGSYPSLFLSGVRPTQVLKGGNSSRIKAGFTKPLVVMQFALSAFLIISSIIMYRQMEFLTTKDLGYNQHQLLTISTMTRDSKADRLVERFRHMTAGISGVESVSGVSTAFTKGWSQNGYRIDGEEKQAYVYAVDPFFLETMEMHLDKGRNFRENYPADTNSLIVNQALVEDMGWEDPLEEHLNWLEDSTGLGYRIIGVVKDFHNLSLESKVEPMFMTLSQRVTGHLNYIMVRMKPNAIPETVASLEDIWKELEPDKPFDYSFLDQDVEAQYASFERWMNIMRLSTFFAILISCLGLFGLAGVNAVNRTREIGIRKVMGAELMNILVLLNRPFLYLSAMAFLIASPVAWYVMNRWWFDDYAYTVPISWEIFAISLGAGTLLALLTVSYHALRAAMVNPADTLKYE